jgi:hypothetical protein
MGLGVTVRKKLSRVPRLVVAFPAIVLRAAPAWTQGPGVGGGLTETAGARTTAVTPPAKSSLSTSGVWHG